MRVYLFSFKLFSMMAITFLAALLIPTNSAKAEITYGPVKSGQTLWQIADGIRPDDSFSIEQFAYAIYDLNPDAFQSGNMNLLDKGVFLRIPESEAILKTTHIEAKKLLNRHVHALDVLRVDAKQLITAKANTKVYKRQIKKVQKQLGKYRHRSRDWNLTYRKLVKSKRSYKKSKKKVARLRRLLLEKATLKYAKPSKPTAAIVDADTDLNEVNQRLTSIQSSLQNLNQSNNSLVEKVEALSKLNQRVKVLEEELGKNDELVIQLKNTLVMAQQAIEQQRLESKDFNQRLEELKASNENSSTTTSDSEDVSAEITPEEPSQIQTAEIQEAPEQDSVSEISPDTESLDNETNTVVESSPSQEPATLVETIDTDAENVTNATDPEALISQDEVHHFSGTPILSIQNETPQHENLSDIIREVTSTFENNNSQDSFVLLANEVGMEVLDESLVEVVATKEDHQKHRHSENTTTDSSLNELREVSLSNMEKSAMAIRTAFTTGHIVAFENKKEIVKSRQRDFMQYPSSDVVTEYQMKPLRNKIILFGGILNGLILLFVLFKLFSGKKDELEFEKSEASIYQSWQERHKPRQTNS